MFFKVQFEVSNVEEFGRILKRENKMIKIVNWILTRKCNLRCDFCRIVRNYDSHPVSYPKIEFYNKNEMSTDFIIDGLKRIKKHNPNSFHIFYGGEPTVRKDLAEILKFCNNENILYTVISNCIDKKKIEELFSKVGRIRGFTTSVDPIILQEESSDRFRKAKEGFDFLKKLSKEKIVSDIVAEVTVDKLTLNLLEGLVSLLSFYKIHSSITFVDISKSKFYDFSNVTNPDILVSPDEARKEIQKLKNEKYLVHIPEMLEEVVNKLPSNLDCEIEKDIHNITVDADGKIRLCLRIRGENLISLNEGISKDGIISDLLIKNLKQNKINFCKLCNWTCMIMSKAFSENDILLH